MTESPGSEQQSSPGAVSEGRLRAAQALAEREEGATNVLSGALGQTLTAIAVIMALLHLYAAYAVVPAFILRPLHVGFVLVLTFLLFPAAGRFRNRVMPWDWLLVAAALLAIGYILWGGDELADRAVFPEPVDLVVSLALILLVLEATRRTAGLVMLTVVLLFLAYALLGAWLPAPWTHRGYELDRLAGHLVLTLEGIFGPAIDVSSTLIILFTLFGAFLQQSGAGKFFIDFAFAAMGRKPDGAGRTVVLATFLLGAASGSGVANTVTVGSVAYPLLAKAGYAKDTAGGLLAAGGLGALLAPPVLGAAAFLIAEFLKISYLDVMRMAVVPACLYYFSLFLMVRFDAKRFGIGMVELPQASLPGLLRSHGFHFLSLVSIVVFLLLGFSPILAVFWAIVVAFGVSFLRRDSALVPRKLVAALRGGATGVLNVAVTCAAAGIIVGVVTLTGLGLKFSSIVVSYAGGSLALTALYTGLIVWVVGLAVPVTASYIICAVVAAPALIQMGVPDFAAHMFVFYYAVLSEVSPPTALSPFAAAAITGGNPYRTTLQAWKYTVPAFLLPFAFVLEPAGVGLLLQGPLTQILLTSGTAALGIGALTAGFQGWLLRDAGVLVRGLLLAAGMALIYPAASADLLGTGLLLIAVLLQTVQRRS
ncbi:MAG: TRAP transporter fused permease subunit [Burkholderiales bacterium]|nr:TRAP transporter fused permease subunit [Burkholderiales bacterium]